MTPEEKKLTVLRRVFNKLTECALNNQYKPHLNNLPTSITKKKHLNATFVVQETLKGNNQLKPKIKNRFLTMLLTSQQITATGVNRETLSAVKDKPSYINNTVYLADSLEAFNHSPNKFYNQTNEDPKIINHLQKTLEEDLQSSNKELTYMDLDKEPNNNNTNIIEEIETNDF